MLEEGNNVSGRTSDVAQARSRSSQSGSRSSEAGSRATGRLSLSDNARASVSVENARASARGGSTGSGGSAENASAQGSIGAPPPSGGSFLDSSVLSDEQKNFLEMQKAMEYTGGDAEGAGAPAWKDFGEHNAWVVVEKVRHEPEQAPSEQAPSFGEENDERSVEVGRRARQRWSFGRR